jgi:hypothetical protein
VQRMWQREDHVHVRHVQQLALTRGQPPVACLCLTLRTMPIPTRVVPDGPMSAGATLIDSLAISPITVGPRNSPSLAVLLARIPSRPLPDAPTELGWTCPQCGAPMLLGPVLTARQLAWACLGFDTS